MLRSLELEEPLIIFILFTRGYVMFIRGLRIVQRYRSALALKAH